MPVARLVDAVGLLLLCACSALAALIELLLVPLYSGATLVPIAALLAVVGNVVLPRLAHVLVPSGLATAAPFVVWLVVVFAIGLTARPEGDVILPGGGGAVQWNGYAVVFGGAVAGVLAVVLRIPIRRARG
jgi:hypothetical protein